MGEWGEACRCSVIQSGFIHQKYTERQPSAQHREPLLKQQLLSQPRFPTQVPSQTKYGNCPSRGTNDSSVEEKGTTEVIREGCPEVEAGRTHTQQCPELPPLPGRLPPPGSQASHRGLHSPPESPASPLTHPSREEGNRHPRSDCTRPWRLGHLPPGA